MRSGRLDNLVTIMRSTMVDDGFGSQVPGPPAPVADLRAEIIQASTDEFIRAWGASTETVIIFRVRYISDVTVSDFIKYDAKEYRIVEVKPIGRHRGLELRCTKRGN